MTDLKDKKKRKGEKGDNVTVENFIDSFLKADEAKHGALYRNVTKQKLPIWFVMLHLFKNVAEGREQHPQYVIDLQFYLFPVISNSTWYLHNLRETFRPFLHRPDEIIPRINQTEELDRGVLQVYGGFAAAIPQKVPHYYESCEAADWHKGIAVLP
ncbi:hypothetical protein DAPPUDRAFT_329908 [Daphnia pulex]|uniref:Uncharacterized protein n=1 Tax=Daphnia pulex TaxID=6669 RepID=E9HHZ3_DAPPU|nr:hypothetical protein DAPPUDRAFT_329908 [Daphnia pulex]|eukprot:EFX68656.1 hypothetical protein DAPPUDRAFT_329908 [Daphnia pulex]